jgi:hypothetical protein
MLNLDRLNFARFHIWQFIVGHTYVNVGTAGYTYDMVLRALEEAMGEDFQKPVVLLGVLEMGGTDFRASLDLELLDHTFGV